jgi:hypothetical protein
MQCRDFGYIYGSEIKKMRYFLLLITTLFGIELCAQSCKCSSEQFEDIEVEPTKIFNFKNGQQFKLCSVATYNFKQDTITYYKDFIISNCNTQKTVNLLGITEYSTIFFNKDTLSIKEIIELPIGKRRKFIRTAISESKYYYEENKLSATKQNIALPKYNNREIHATLEEYKRTKGKNIGFKRVYARLLIAGLSGNAESLRYFINFEKKFGDLMTPDEMNDYKFLKSIFKSIL